AIEARNSSAGLNASARPLTSVSSTTSASLHAATLPWASSRRAVTLYSSISSLRIRHRTSREVTVRRDLAQAGGLLSHDQRAIARGSLRARSRGALRLDMG